MPSRRRPIGDRCGRRRRGVVWNENTRSRQAIRKIRRNRILRREPAIRQAGTFGRENQTGNGRPPHPRTRGQASSQARRQAQIRGQATAEADAASGQGSIPSCCVAFHHAGRQRSGHPQDGRQGRSDRLKPHDRPWPHPGCGSDATPDIERAGRAIATGWQTRIESCNQASAKIVRDAQIRRSHARRRGYCRCRHTACPSWLGRHAGASARRAPIRPATAGPGGATRGFARRSFGG